MVKTERKWKPTKTMLQLLRNIAAGRFPGHGLPAGRSFAGGLNSTRAALRSRGYLNIGDDITDAGRKLIEENE